jgi:hypothetical protein
MNFDLTIPEGYTLSGLTKVNVHMLNCSSWDTGALQTVVEWFFETLRNRGLSGVSTIEDRLMPVVVVFVDQKRSREAKRTHRRVWHNPLVEERSSHRAGDTVVVIALQHPMHLSEMGAVEKLIASAIQPGTMSKEMMTELIQVMQRGITSLQMWSRQADPSAFDIFEKVPTIQGHKTPKRKKPKALKQLLEVQDAKRLVRMGRARCYDAMREYSSARRHFRSALSKVHDGGRVDLQGHSKFVIEAEDAARERVDELQRYILELNQRITDLIAGGDDGQA